MPRRQKTSALLFAILCSPLTVSGALAQQQPPRSPIIQKSAPRPVGQVTQASPPAVAQPDLPQRTTATYEAWVVQCEMQKGPPPKKACEMEQVAQVQGRNVPFSRIAVAQPTKGQPTKVIVQLPVNISFAKTVRIKIGDSDPGLTAPYARCVPSGCFAELDLKEADLKNFRGASGAGQLSFADSTGTEITVPVTFGGFAQAFDALTRE